MLYMDASPHTGVRNAKGVREFQPRVASTLGSSYRNISTLKGFARCLIPNIPFVIINGVCLEERPVLILERHAFVMFFLVLDVLDDLVKV